MKRIDLDSVQPPDMGSVRSAHRFYRITLGNRRALHFTSMRESKAFQAATTRFLVETIMELNDLYSEAHSQYRAAWPTLSHDNAPRCHNAAVRLRTALQTACEALEAGSAVRGPNRMFFAWSHLNHCATHTKAAYAVLVEWYRYKTQGTSRYQAATGARRCQEVLDRLANYGS